MPHVTVRIPGLLAEFADDEREHEVAAETPDDAIDALIAAYPRLDPHIRNPQSELRTHLQVYVDGRNVEWVKPSPVTVSDGSVIELYQAVSGG